MNNIYISNPTIYIIVPEQFQHKFNFLFCQIFEKLFITCAKILIKLGINKISTVKLGQELKTDIN
jgi:hypothetical protein